MALGFAGSSMNGVSQLPSPASGGFIRVKLFAPSGATKIAFLAARVDDVRVSRVDRAESAIGSVDLGGRRAVDDEPVRADVLAAEIGQRTIARRGAEARDLAYRESGREVRP